jgi:hypothetical protein
MGFSLTRDDLTSSYTTIRHNIRIYRCAGVLAVVRGRHNAESELKKFEDSQDSFDRQEGWRYFIAKYYPRVSDSIIENIWEGNCAISNGDIEPNSGIEIPTMLRNNC